MTAQPLWLIRIYELPCCVETFSFFLCSSFVSSVSLSWRFSLQLEWRVVILWLTCVQFRTEMKWSVEILSLHTHLRTVCDVWTFILLYFTHTYMYCQTYNTCMYTCWFFVRTLVDIMYSSNPNLLKGKQVVRHSCRTQNSALRRTTRQSSSCRHKVSETNLKK